MYININSVTDDLIDSFNMNYIKRLKKYYGKEDFKEDFINDLKYKFKFNIYSDKPIQNEKSFFHIVSFRKDYSKPFPLIAHYNILQWGLISRFDWIQFERPRNFYEIKAIMQISNNKSNIQLKKGETLNIEIPYYPHDFISDDNILKPAILSLISKLNFNFTFLIELDPL